MPALRPLSVVVLLLAAATTAHAQVRFSASDVSLQPSTKGRIRISNNSSRITAYQFYGDVEKALFSLKSSRSLATHSYGLQLFDSSARVSSAPAELAAIFEDAARTHHLDARLLAAVAHQESHFNPGAVSPVGALGVMQLMPQTARYLGVDDPMDAKQSVMGGARYLRKLLDTFHGDLDLTLAAYNAGPGAVQRYNGIPPYRETMNYVTSIRKNYEAALRVR